MNDQDSVFTSSETSRTLEPNNQIDILARILSREAELGVSSAETYVPSLKPREVALWRSSSELSELLRELAQRRTSQLHCSYFGNPSCLFAGPQTKAYNALKSNFGGASAMQSYYGDLSGEHAIERVCDEYELAIHAGLDHYTAHFGIDYSFSDGMYDYAKEYGFDRHDVLQACVLQTETYLRRIYERLLSKNLLGKQVALPTIGIENAGWGLEYGIQDSSDFKALFTHLEDRNVPLRELVMVDWDLNHLLHALGRDRSSKRASFFLPEDEITEVMHRLVSETKGECAALAMRWISENVLDPKLLPRVRCIHLSDCSWKSEAYFARCQAVGVHLRTLEAETSPEQRAALGEQMVLTYYDNHLHLGSADGMLEKRFFAPFARALQAEEARRSSTLHVERPLILLHELKNYPFSGSEGGLNQEVALQRQVEFLRGCGVFFQGARLEVRF